MKDGYKTFFLFLILYIPTFSYSQVDTFTINGSIEGIDKAIIKIWQPRFDSTFYLFNESVPLNTGRFQIQGHLSFPSLTTLVAFDEKGDVLLQTEWFYISPGSQDVSIFSTKNGVELRSNARSYTEYIKEFLPEMDRLQREKKEVDSVLTNDKEAIGNTSYRDSLNRLSEWLSMQQDIFLLEYIIAHPNSYISLMELAAAIRSDPYSLYFFEKAFSFLTPELQQTTVGQSIMTDIKYGKKTIPGALFPNFNLIDLGKNKTKLFATQMGTFTLVDCWFHNCGYCIEQFPELKAIYEEFHSRGFEIIGITIDQDRFVEDWEKVIQKYELPWLQYRDQNGKQCARYLIHDFPTNFLLNTNGEIIAKNIDLKKLEAFLEEHL